MMRTICLFLAAAGSLIAGEVYIESAENEEKGNEVREKYTSEKTVKTYHPPNVRRRKPEPKQVRSYYDNRIYVGGQVAYMLLNIKNSLNVIQGADQDRRLGGVLGGALVAYEMKKFRSLYTGLFGNFLTGKISRRRGASVPSRDIWDVEAEGRFGYNYRGLQGNRMEVTPYIGFGFTYFYQKRSSNGATFQYYKYYLPVGFLFNYALFDFLHFGFHFKWFPDIDPTLKTSLARGARWVVQKENGQILVEVPMTLRYGECRQWDISLVPFWKRKKDGSTIDTGTVLGIPKQTHIYWGGTLNIGYSF